MERNQQSEHLDQMAALDVAALSDKLTAVEAELHALRVSRAGRRAAFLGRTTLGRIARGGIVASLLMLALGHSALASVPDASGTIHACYAHRAGLLRVLDTAANQQCLRSETALTWNQAGPQGAQGPAGPAGLAWQGQWATSKTYATNDAVFDKGSSWIALAANTGSEPSASNTNWSLLAQQGSQVPAATPDIVYVKATNTVKGLVAQEIRTYCPAGKQAISGGYILNVDVNIAKNVTVSSSAPLSNASGNYWGLVVENYNDPNQPNTTITVNSWAVCEMLAPGVAPQP